MSEATFDNVVNTPVKKRKHKTFSRFRVVR